MFAIGVGGINLALRVLNDEDGIRFKILPKSVAIGCALKME